MSKRKYTLGQAHLLRRRGKNKFWTGWHDGREVSLGTADRGEAQRWLDALPAQRTRVEGSDPPTPPPLLSALALLFAEYCQPPRHTTKTAVSYANRVTNFVEWAEDRKVTRADQITFKLMSDFVRHRAQKGVAAGTINRDTIAIRLMFAFALREGHIQEDPFEQRAFKSLKLKEPKAKPDAVTLSPQQVDAFITAAEMNSAKAYAALFKLAAGSGLRIDETRHLDVSDLDEKQRLLTVTPKEGWTSKGYRYRTMPVSEATLKAAKTFIATRNTVPTDDKTVWRELHRIRALCDLPRFSMHDLRRAWASAMHRNGASLKQVSLWLGHRDVATTERYVRVYMTDTQMGHEYLPR